MRIAISKTAAARAGLFAVFVGASSLFASASNGQIQTRFVLGTQGFEAFCLAPLLAGQPIDPPLVRKSDDEWWASDDVVLGIRGNKVGERVCSFTPSPGQDVSAETLDLMADNFKNWLATRGVELKMRPYTKCAHFGEGHRIIADTPPTITGKVVRVVLETREYIDHFILLAAETSVFTPPADCALE